MSAEHVSFSSEQLSPRDYFREYLSGQQLSLDAYSPEIDGFAKIHDNIVIESVAGGGFFGRVLLPADRNYVLKTSVPDPLHYYLRSKNWNGELFPPQHSEIAAARTVIASRLIAEALPAITDGKFAAPTSYGYTKLPEGYAYLVEKMYGRGPKYNTDRDELKAFKEAQRELAEVAYELGLEHVGQIHPDNPFGMANLWWDENKNQWIWLDTIPAIPHRSKIWPGMHYGFHEEIRNFFQSEEPTFDTIHTDMFRRAIEKRRADIPDDVYANLMADLHLYEDLVREEQAHTAPAANDSDVANAALKLSLSNVFTERSLIRYVSDENYRAKINETITSLIADPQFRTDWLNRRGALRGVYAAHERGYVSEDELVDIKHSVDMQTYGMLAGYFKAAGLLADGVLLAGGAGAAVNHFTPVAHIDPQVAFLAWVTLPSTMRYLGVRAAEKMKGRRYDSARQIGLIPLFPLIGYAGLAVQMSSDMGESDPAVAHYLARSIVVDATKFVPQAGWGTEFEGLVMQKLDRAYREYIKAKNRAGCFAGKFNYAVGNSIPL